VGLPGVHSSKELLGFLLRSSKRIVVLVVGLALVAGGVALLVLPGPGLLVIIAGLAVLASEFAWAETMLDKAKQQASKAGGAAKQGIGRLRRRRDQDGGVTPPPST
jgi:uncharacterized protein (TIGR02611 family)